MFDEKNIKAMADKARQNLKDQQDVEASQNQENIYADMISESNEETVEQIDGKQEYNIKQNPDFIEEYPEIRRVYDEDELEQNPQINEFDRPIFVGGPLQSQIDSWKKQYIGYMIYVTEIAGEYFVFRTLNRFEYKQIVSLQNTDPLMREEIICETCSIWPEHYKWDTIAVGKAGIPSTFSQIIMEKSGFTKDYSIQVL